MHFFSRINGTGNIRLANQLEGTIYTWWPITHFCNIQTWTSCHMHSKALSKTVEVYWELSEDRVRVDSSNDFHAANYLATTFVLFKQW